MSTYRSWAELSRGLNQIDVPYDERSPYSYTPSGQAPLDYYNLYRGDSHRPGESLPDPTDRQLRWGEPLSLAPFEYWSTSPYAANRYANAMAETGGRGAEPILRHQTWGLRNIFDISSLGPVTTWNDLFRLMQRAESNNNMQGTQYSSDPMSPYNPDSFTRYSNRFFPEGNIPSERTPAYMFMKNFDENQHGNAMARWMQELGFDAVRFSEDNTSHLAILRPDENYPSPARPIREFPRTLVDDPAGVVNDYLQTRQDSQSREVRLDRLHAAQRASQLREWAGQTYGSEGLEVVDSYANPGHMAREDVASDVQARRQDRERHLNWLERQAQQAELARNTAIRDSASNYAREANARLNTPGPVQQGPQRVNPLPQRSTLGQVSGMFAPGYDPRQLAGSGGVDANALSNIIEALGGTAFMPPMQIDQMMPNSQQIRMPVPSAR